MATHLSPGRIVSIFAIVFVGLGGAIWADHSLTQRSAPDGLALVDQRVVEAQPQAPSMDPMARSKSGTEIRVVRDGEVRRKSRTEIEIERGAKAQSDRRIEIERDAELVVPPASGPANEIPATAAAAEGPRQIGSASAPGEPAVARVSATVLPQASQPAPKATEAAPQAPETAPGTEKILAERADEREIEREIKALMTPERKPENGSMVKVSLRGDASAPTSVPATSRSAAAPQASKAAARDAKALFQKGKEIKIKRDANVYITPGNIPKNDRFLKAYSADQAAKGTSAPGLLGIATQAYRTQASAGTANKAYSLADAMRDAVWRKKTAAKLKSLMSTQRACAGGADGASRRAPSIGLVAAC